MVLPAVGSHGGLPRFLVRLAFAGPLLPLIRVPAVHKLPALPAGEAATWRLDFRILGTAPLSFQAFVHLPAKSAVLPGAALLF
jgi:hypothetical protein